MKREVYKDGNLVAVEEIPDPPRWVRIVNKLASSEEPKVLARAFEDWVAHMKHGEPLSPQAQMWFEKRRKDRASEA